MENTEKARAAAPAAPQPAFRLAPVFGDHMVLQRGQPVPVWGEAPAGTRVRVTCRGQEKWSPVCAGRWMVQLDPLTPGSACPLVAECLPADAAAGAGGWGESAASPATTRIECVDVVVGDVYLAGGQSNMEYRMRESLDAKAWIPRADLPRIRSFFAPRVPYVGAQADEPDAPFCRPPVWQVCTPETSPDFSAVAFHFARSLQADIDVPVGILDANWGGSSATCWLAEEDLESDPLLMPWVAEYRSLLETIEPATYEAERAAYAAAVDAWVARDREAMAKGLSASERETFVGGYPWPPPNGPKNALSPFGLYHTMLEPLAPYAVAGALWYQGETDAGETDPVDPASGKGAEKYGRLLGTMIARWRRLFGQADLPFLVVQLASYGCDSNPDGDAWAVLREQQMRLAAQDARVFTAPIHDVGDRTDIHPKHKQPVGERLALLAKRHLYGLAVPAAGPAPVSTERDGAAVLIRFGGCTGALEAGSRDPLAMEGARASADGRTTVKGFALAGPDGVYHTAQAVVESTTDGTGATVRVRADAVPEPAAVRYGWANYTEANLFGGTGLPVAPFRMRVPAGGCAVESETTGCAAAVRKADGMRRQARIDKAVEAMLCLQRQCWEQAVGGRALVRAGKRGLAIGFARDAALRQRPDGRPGMVEDCTASTDAIAHIPLLAYAASETGEERLTRALAEARRYAYEVAPRDAEGTLYHVIDAAQYWSDSPYMAPPAFAALGDTAEAVRQLRGMKKALWDPEKRMMRHIRDAKSGGWVRGLCWGGGNGWTAAGLAEVITRLPADSGVERDELVAWHESLLAGCIAHRRTDGLFHDIVDDPASFVESNLGQMLAYSIYEGVHGGWLDASWLPEAHAMREAAISKIDRDGLLQGACGSPFFDRPGTSTEAQAFTILMETAAAPFVRD